MGPHPPNKWMGFPPPCQWVPRGSEDFPTQWLLMVLLTPTCHYLLIQCYKQQKTFWAKAHFCVSTKMMKRRHNLWFSVNCKWSGSSWSFCRIATSVTAVSCAPVAGGERPSIWNNLDKYFILWISDQSWQMWFGSVSWNCLVPERWFSGAQLLLRFVSFESNKCFCVNMHMLVSPTQTVPISI